MVYGFLPLAIVLEIVGPTAHKETHGLTRLLPASVSVVGLGASFYGERPNGGVLIGMALIVVGVVVTHIQAPAHAAQASAATPC